MLNCSRCQKSVPEDSLKCPACGAPIDDAPTRVLDSKESSAKSTPTSSKPSYDAIDDARFVPGTILAERPGKVHTWSLGGNECLAAADLVWIETEL